MPDVTAVLSIALEHSELGPVALTCEIGQVDPAEGVAMREGMGGPLDGDDLRTARCAALRDYRRFADR
jgi:hypothetical protein